MRHKQAGSLRQVDSARWRACLRPRRGCGVPRAGLSGVSCGRDALQTVPHWLAAVLNGTMAPAGKTCRRLIPKFCGPVQDCPRATGLCGGERRGKQAAYLQVWSSAHRRGGDPAGSSPERSTTRPNLLRLKAKGSMVTMAHHLMTRISSIR